MKNLLLELAYVGLGSMAATKHKTEEWLEKIVSNQQVNRDEGKKIVKALKERIHRAKDQTASEVEVFIDRFSEKSKLAREEVSEVLKAIVEKPKYTAKHLVRRTDELAEKISQRTAMTKIQAQTLLKEFIDDVTEIKAKAEEKGEQLLHQMNEMGTNGKTIVHELGTRSEAIINEVKPHLQKAMDKVIDQLHLANAHYVHSLEKRIEELEKKEISK